MLVIIFLILIIFIFYNNKKKETFLNNNEIYKEKFLNIIEILKSNKKYNFNYNLNIISSINKKNLNIKKFEIGFNNLKIDNNTNLKLKKIKDKFKIKIYSLNNLFLTVNKDNTLSYSILDNEDNIFELYDLKDKYKIIEYNKFRFTSKLKYKNLFLNTYNLDKKGEFMYFDIKIN